MKKLKFHLLYLLLLLAISTVASPSYGQKADQVSKIVIEYGRNAYLKKKPELINENEKIEISKNDAGTYNITAYSRTSTFVDRDSTREVEKLLRVGKSIDRKLVHRLLLELDSTPGRFDVNYIKPKLKKPTRREILRVAAKYDERWRFKNEFSDAEDRARAFKEMKSFLYLDTLVSWMNHSLEYPLILTHSYNNLKISVLREVNSTEYLSNSFGQSIHEETLGQPFEIKLNGKPTGKTTANLDINITLGEILPSGSITKDILDLNSLKENYILWYLKNKF